MKFHNYLNNDELERSVLIYKSADKPHDMRLNGHVVVNN